MRSAEPRVPHIPRCSTGSLQFLMSYNVEATLRARSWLRRITHDAGAPDDMLMGRHFGASAHANRCLRNVTELNEQGTIVNKISICQT